MRLMTAHRILIVTAIVFFLGYAVWELSELPAGGGSWGRAAFSTAGAVFLAIYFRNLRGK